MSSLECRTRCSDEHYYAHCCAAAMAELAAALAALAGTGPSSTASAATPKPLSPGALGAHPTWFVPPHLLRLPAVRAAAFAAHDSSIEAVNHPHEFDRVYRYGLNLQAGAGGDEGWGGTLHCRLHGVTPAARRDGCKPGTRGRPVVNQPVTRAVPTTYLSYLSRCAGAGQQAVGAAGGPAVPAAPGCRGLHGGVQPGGGAPRRSPL